jgi:cerevisin
MSASSAINTLSSVLVPSTSYLLHLILTPTGDKAVSSVFFALIILHYSSSYILPIMRGVLGLSVLPLLASASPVLVDSIHNGAAPILSSTSAKELPNSYVVVFKKHVTDDVAAAHHSWVQNVHFENQHTRTELRKRTQFPFSDTVFEGFKHTYNIAGGFLGYSGHFDDETIEQVRQHPDVSAI